MLIIQTEHIHTRTRPHHQTKNTTRFSHSLSPSSSSIVVSSLPLTRTPTITDACLRGCITLQGHICTPHPGLARRRRSSSTSRPRWSFLCVWLQLHLLRWRERRCIADCKGGKSRVRFQRTAMWLGCGGGVGVGWATEVVWGGDSLRLTKLPTYSSHSTRCSMSSNGTQTFNTPHQM